jgi:AraC-like DNA-binding protein
MARNVGWKRREVTGARRDFAGEVRQVVASSFAGRYPNIQRVAGAIGMSARTLQRRLGEDGVTYAQVVARARAEMARQMLRDSAWKIGEIGRTIGYSNAGHFTRAFLRWTGRTPRDFRRLGRNPAEGVLAPRRKPGPR